MRIPLIASCLLAAGCASYDGSGLRPGVSSEAELRGVMGTPALEFREADGSRRLAYPHGPLGHHTFMADVGPDGIVRGVRQVLDDDVFFHIQPGMTREQVLHLIGPPGDSMAFSRTGHVAWDWRYQDTWGYPAIFSVTFDRDGIVVSKISQRIERDRSRF